MTEFERWLERAEDNEIKNELLSVAGKDKEIEDRFYKSLSFGTGGLRGIIGAGTNRMNIYTVGKATFGLAEYLLATGGNSIVIAYDSRNKSAEFARLSAEIMSYKGIKAYLFSELTPTPVLSFAVRYLKASAGIVITASHNPKEYNGYKVYNSLGCQITDEAAKAITAKINEYDYFNDFTPNNALIEVLDDRVKTAFLEAIKAFSLTKITEANAPSIVYSPLHGTGRKYVQAILEEMGIKAVHTVKEQEMPDGNFTTCPYPNPEEKDALALALRDAEKYKPDLVMATDPDADRVGIAIKDEKSAYKLINGNETGSILLYYILLKKQEMGIPCTGSMVIKTIVTTDIIFDMAKEYGVEVKEVLTGFKYIGEALEETEDYLLGLEESYGYLIGTHARDKDAVSACMLIAEACAYFKEKGKSLYQVLQEIYERYGYYQTELKSISLPGKDGMEKMKEILANIRKNPPKEIDGQPLIFDDFAQGLYGLPKSDVLRFKNENYRLIIRPSGTEPKMKIYLQAKGFNQVNATEKVNNLLHLKESLLKL
ncbi:MAG: phospho-sugar mutase [Clostridia bacterium]|nr:phospho-sugar mutase [Clostridia bacterium]